MVEILIFKGVNHDSAQMRIGLGNLNCNILRDPLFTEPISNSSHG